MEALGRATILRNNEIVNQGEITFESEVNNKVQPHYHRSGAQWVVPGRLLDRDAGSIDKGYTNG